MTTTKLCVDCGQDFTRGSSVTNAKWASRICCVRCSKARGGRATRTWTDEQLQDADAMQRGGMQWRDIWPLVGDGHGSHDSLRIAVAGWRKAHGGKPQPASPPRKCWQELEEEDDEAARTLERPTGWQLLLLRCEPPEVLRRLAAWNNQGQHA